MELNTLKPAPGSKHVRKRVARGIGSGTGKTGGRGHKGQRARSGGFHKVGFEGGQMPLQRRLPKRGFNSPTREDTAEVLLSDLERVKAEKIDLAVLKEAGVVPGSAKAAKVIVSGKLTRKVTLTGVAVSKGARAAVPMRPSRNPNLNASRRLFRRPSLRPKPARGRKTDLKSTRAMPGKRANQKADAPRKTRAKGKTNAKRRKRGPGRRARRAEKPRWPLRTRSSARPASTAI